MSLGSIDESVAAFEVCFDLKLISQEKFNELESVLESLSRQLGGFSKVLKVSS